MDAMSAKYDARIESVNESLKASIIKHLNPTLETKIFDVDHRLKLLKDDMDSRLASMNDNIVALEKDVTLNKDTSIQALAQVKNNEQWSNLLE